MASVPVVCRGNPAVCQMSHRVERSGSGDPGSELCQAIRFFWGGCASVADDVAGLQGLGSLANGVYNLVAGNDIATLTNAHASGTDKFLAVLDLSSNVLVFEPFGGTEAEALKFA